MKKSIYISFIIVLFIWNVPCHAAAIYDVTGAWIINETVTVKDSSGTIVNSFPYTFTGYCQQTNMAPNDYFELDADFMASNVYGHVFDDLYVVDGPTSGLPAQIPQDTRPWAFTGGEGGPWYHQMYDEFSFTVGGGGTTISGYWHTTLSGYYMLDPTPGEPVYYDPSQANWTWEASLTGSPIPIPSAMWLLGSAFIGLVGFRKKIRKEA